MPDDPKEVVAVRKKAPRFYYNAIMQTLYHRSYDRILLRCLSHKEAQEVLKRLMMTCMELTNLVQNLEIDFEDWDIIGQR